MAKRKSRPQTESVPAAKAVVGMNAWAGGSNPSCGTEPDSRLIARAAGMMRHTGALARSGVARDPPAPWLVQRGIFPGRTLPQIAPKRRVLSRTFASFGFGSRVRSMLPQSEPASEDRRMPPGRTDRCARLASQRRTEHCAKPRVRNPSTSGTGRTSAGRSAPVPGLTSWEASASHEPLGFGQNAPRSDSITIHRRFVVE